MEKLNECVIFCRVSSKEQEETGYSLPAQEKLLTEYTTKKGFIVNKVFSLSESANGKKQRAVFLEMLKYLKDNKINILVVEKVDRLTRSFKHANMIDEWLEENEERQVHLVKDSLILHKNSRSQEKLNWGIRILFAKNYIDNLSEEVRKGHKEKVEQGWLPTKPPVGYKTIGEKGHKIHIIDDEKAPLVKRMFELYATGEYSLDRLTELMYKEGLVNDNGNKIVKSRIHTLLSDPFYIGKNRWNGVVTKGEQQTFISKETFDKCQDILKGKKASKYQRHNFLFRNLVTCKECQGVITWEHHKGHVYGYCNHYNDCGQTKGYREDKLEEDMLFAIRSLQLGSTRIIGWIRKALLESHKEEIVYHESAISELNKRLSMVKKKSSNLYDDRLEDRITKAMYDEKAKELTKEEEEIMEAMNKHNNSNVQYMTLGMNIYDVSQNASEIYARVDPENRKELIKLIFDELKVVDGKLEYEYSYPFKIIFNAVCQTNLSMPKSSKVEESRENPKIKFELADLQAMTVKNGVLADGYPIKLLG